MEQGALTPQDIVSEVKEGRRQIGTLVNPIDLQEIEHIKKHFASIEFYPYKKEIEYLTNLSSRLFENIKQLEDKADEVVALYLMKCIKMDTESINLGRAQINVGFR